MAHELSHQWWGNAVTNRDWNQWAERRHCQLHERRLVRTSSRAGGGYQRHIGAAREKYEQLRAAGADKPLVFPDWRAPTAMDRSLVYDKGAWVVHLLRETMGEAAFCAA